jgi:two-component system nitrogen regulation response regulator NtrX
MARDILIVDDEADIRHLIQGILEDEGYTTRQAGTAKQAFAAISDRAPSLVILDVWLQNSEFDGLAILEQIKVDHPHLPVIMISGHSTIETAVTALKQGAYDFIEKPFKADRLLMMMDRALETTQLRLENQDLKKKADNPFMLSGNSNAIQQLLSMIDRVALTNSRVLLTGESGAGKEITARTIHKKSPREKNPFVLINCATISPQRMEQELFGYEENGLIHTGVLERANTGTLLLDEVADMPLETQSKIVRVLQDQSFLRVGGNDMIKVDVRIIASTSRDLRAAMNDGKFREDLYYRLNVVPVAIPPLRARLDDIPHLIENFVEHLGTQNNLPKREFSVSSMLALQSYDWPGNVRQLKNLIEWLLIMGAGTPNKIVEIEDLPPEISGKIPETLKTEWGADLIGLPLREAREVFEREYLLSQVHRFGGNISKTAQFIGMERSALHRKLKSLNINTNERDDELPAQSIELKKSA